MLYLEMISISRIPFINHISHLVYVELFKIEFWVRREIVY